MSDFLFHKVSESEKESIKKQAKGIMDGFSEKLARIDGKISEPIIERKNFERHEMQGSKPNHDFRKRMFENAQNKNDDFIIAEKKSW